MRGKRFKKRTYAPRLANGDLRVEAHLRLSPPIKEGLRAISHSEKQSMDWVVEQVIIDYFHLKQPKYKGDIEKTRRRE